MDILKRQYFAMVPVKDIQWQSVGNDWKSFSIAEQEEALLNTVLHPKSIEFPTTISYNRSFLKYFISQLESVGAEIVDEFYEVYTNLVALPDVSEGEYCFKTYFVSGSSDVSLIESRSLISQGTTGLQTWQAAKFLAEWVLQNKDHFKAKNVLELGSGLGLLGLVTCGTCDVRTYNFTDCHESVLKLLARNIEINATSNQCLQNTNDMNNIQTNVKHFLESIDKYPMRNKDLVNMLGESDMKEDVWSKVQSTSQPMEKWKNIRDSRIMLTKLDWEKTSQELLSKGFADVNITLASDVVFDTRIIPALVKVLGVLTRKPHSVIYIASTVRNPATRDHFLHALDADHLKYEFITDTPDSVFFYDKTVPIQLVKITE